MSCAGGTPLSLSYSVCPGIPASELGAQEPQPASFPASWHVGWGGGDEELSCWGLWAGKQVAWEELWP